MISKAKLLSQLPSSKDMAYEYRCMINNGATFDAKLNFVQMIKPTAQKDRLEKMNGYHNT